MKLKMSLPERPGWIFVVPGFDFMALLLALVMLAGVVENEGYVEVKLPPTEFRGLRMGEENPVIVLLKRTAAGPVYYISNTKIPQAELSATIATEAEKRGTNVVALHIDGRATVAEELALYDLIARTEYRILKGIRFSEINRKGDR